MGELVAAALFAVVVLANTALAQNGNWTEPTGDGLWSSGANWSGGAVANGSGNTADFSMVDVNAVAVNGAYPGFYRNAVQLDTPRTIGNLTFGDSNASTLGGWEVYSNDVVNNILTLAGVTPTITVNPLGPIDTATLGAATPEVIDDAIIRITLAGTSGFTKSGTGVLTLGGTNPNLTGTINVNQGTLRIASTATFDFESAINAAVTRFNLAGGATIATAASLGQNAAAGAGITVAAGATATINKTGNGNLLFANVSGAGSTLNFNTAGGVNSVDRDWAAAGAFAVVNFTGTTAGTPAQIRLRNNGGTFNANSFATTAVNLNNVILFTNTNSGGNTNVLGSLSGTSTSTLQGGASGTVAIYQIGGLNTDTTFAGAVTTGTGINIFKAGNGKLTLSGNLTYTTTNNGNNTLRGGHTRITAGTLALSGTAAIPGGIVDPVLGNLLTTIDVRTGTVFDVSGTTSTYSTAPIQQLVGGGTVTGNYNHDEGVLRPADVPVGNTHDVTRTAGTMTFGNNLSFGGSGGEIVYDMGTNPAAGNDRIQVNGVTDLAGTPKITPNFLTGAPASGLTYTVLSSTGGFTGSPSGWTVAWPGRGAPPTVFTSGTQLQFTTVPIVGGAHLNWSGAAGTAWNINSTVNWFNTDSSAADKYYDGDIVTFGNTSNGVTPVTNFTVDLTTALSPAAVTVDSTTNYTFSGIGSITGTGTFTKRGSSMLIMQKNNTFSGQASIEAGTVDLGGFGGALGTGNLNLAGATIIGTAAGGFANTGVTVAAATTNTVNMAGGTAAGNSFNIPNLSGTGTLTLTSTVTDKFYVLNNNAGFTGTLNLGPDGVTGTTMSVRLSGAASSMPGATVNIVNGTTLSNRSGAGAVATIAIGSLTGDTTSILNGFVGGSGLPGTNWQIGALNTSTTFAGTIINGQSVSGGVTTIVPSAVTKVGTGTLILSGLNTYTGDTTIGAGTLSITNSYLADTSDVLLTTGGIFNLNFSGPDTIDSLFFDGVSQATGTWGAAGSGAAHISSFFTGTGVLQVTTFTAPPLLIGDYNSNGVVDAADYTVWRDHLGQPFALANRDTNNAGNISTADYDSWKSHFGQTAGSGSNLNSGSVPEPTSAALVVLAVGLAAAARQSSRCRR